MAQLLLLPVSWLLVGLVPVGAPVGSAWAAEEDKPVLGVVHFVKRGDAGLLAVQRIEEYLRQMLDAGGAVRVLPAKVVETGKPLTGAARPAAAAAQPASPQAKAIEKADKLVTAARDIVAEGEALGDAGKLLMAAVDRYEQNYVELVDFSKLVDAYALLAQVSLSQGDSKAASDWVARALAIQPTFVVDGRKQNRDLKALVDKTREGLEAKPRTELQIDATQPDSEVFLDGVKLGTAPVVAKDLLAGVHYVQVRKVGASPWGQTLLAKGKLLQVKAVLQMQVAPENEIAVTVSTEDIKDHANKGSFGEKIFKNSGALFARQIAATHLLFGLVNRRPTTLELHLFVFNAKSKKTCAVAPIEYASNLTNLQMQTLDAEGRVRTAVQTCNSDVSGTPAVFAGGPQPGDEPAAPDIIPTPADPEPRADPKPEPKPDPKPEPRADPRPEPRRSDPPLKRVEKDDPYKDLLKDPEGDKADKPFYASWWFWTAVGVVAVGGGGAGAYLATRGGDGVTGYGVKVTVP
ncbi:MAG: PEGA domain-containing protein [Deltaproteobacteria bacterium]|nr:PEGA domain-containing protein [Deltaproteobacteria bacterium]